MRIIISILIAVSTMPVFAQLPDETSGRVPELDAFHEPIYILWHDAWPVKDVQRLKELFPQVECAHEKLAAALLPGILRDKQKRWNEKKKELRFAIDEYRQSIEGNDTTRILRAAENVHALYEQMVRVVRPIMKEIDEFHRFLYTLHHYYIPEKNLSAIKKNAEDLAVAMNAVDAAVLPKRWEKKKDQFEKNRVLLSAAVKNYLAAVRTEEPLDTLAKRESVVHGQYQTVESVFE